ncbi:hypothetical protein SAMN06295926_10965 [Lysinibacillus sp. AC-3]|nr:hypothetical protein SAMN06295926_10965 [Lysinibacillus sp. AC-3]
MKYLLQLNNQMSFGDLVVNKHIVIGIFPIKEEQTNK